MGSRVFDTFMNDRVTLVKKDGRRFEDSPSSVQPNLILTQDPKIPIEDGDQFERQLPSGIVESFLVLDAGFSQDFHGIPAHYQSKVQKRTAIRPSTAGPQVVYNLIGPNTRVNIQSSDSSTNVVNVETSTLFENLRSVIRESIEDAEVGERIVERVDAMQEAAGTRSFADRYKEFIGVAAAHMTLIAPFLPALTQLLL